MLLTSGTLRDDEKTAAGSCQLKEDDGRRLQGHATPLAASPGNRQIRRPYYKKLNLVDIDQSAVIRCILGMVKMFEKPCKSAETDEKLTTPAIRKAKQDPLG